MITHEPYTAGFTGTLKTLVTKNGTSFTFTKNFVHVEKGQPFMLEIDREKNLVRMLPVLMPDWWMK